MRWDLKVFRMNEGREGTRITSIDIFLSSITVVFSIRVPYCFNTLTLLSDMSTLGSEWILYSHFMNCTPSSYAQFSHIVTLFSFNKVEYNMANIHTKLNSQLLYFCKPSLLLSPPSLIFYYNTACFTTILSILYYNYVNVHVLHITIAHAVLQRNWL